MTCLSDPAKNPTISPGTALAMAVGVAHANTSFSLSALHQFDRPAQDEWGIFDPRQAGVEALLRKLQARSKEADAAFEQSQRAATK